MLKGKKIFVFDLDGTLSKSKLPIDRGMAKLLAELTRKVKVAVAGGGKPTLFREQFLKPLEKERANLSNLFLFPTNGASFSIYKKGWRKEYEIKLAGKDLARIKKALKKALFETDFEYPKRVFGSTLENRGTQVTFSALGDRAPLPLKKEWNRRRDIRPKIVRLMKKTLPDFEVRQGGLTSIDITKKGIDKGYAIKKLMEFLNAPKKDVIFFGDAIFPGGNDYSAKKAGVECVKVSGPEETRKIVDRALRQLFN